MARSRIVVVLPHEEIDPETGKTIFVPGSQSVVPFTAQEEADTDAAAAVEAAAQVLVTQQQQRINAVKVNARRQMLITAIQNNDDAGLIAAVQQRYPSLSGDALKAVSDLALLAAAVIRS